MWLYTKFGFFSIVHGRDPQENVLVVRARVGSDLDRLRADYLPELTPTTASNTTDYQYRGTVTKEQLAAGMQRIALDIDYTNFKNEVERVQGPERHDLYADVWAVNLGMRRIDRTEIMGKLRGAKVRAYERAGLPTPPKRTKGRKASAADPGADRLSRDLDRLLGVGWQPTK